MASHLTQFAKEYPLFLSMSQALKHLPFTSSFEIIMNGTLAKDLSTVTFHVPELSSPFARDHLSFKRAKN